MAASASKLFTIKEDTPLSQRIIILDFGGQYTQLIARRVRQAKVYSYVVSWRTPADELRKMNPTGIILSGSPASIQVEDAPCCDAGVFDLGVPVLGICYGMQLMAAMLGGTVTAGEKQEYGLADTTFDTDHVLFDGLPQTSACWMSHNDRVETLPPGFVSIAHTPDCPNAAMAHDQRRLYGVQFHPEVTHTTHGMRVIESFLRTICGCTGQWDMQGYAEEAVRRIQDTVGEGSVLLGLSGGVDSVVTAALIHRTIGDRLHCVFVDHGFMRKGEPERVREVFTNFFPVHLVCVDAADRFLDKLKGVSDPERKRKIIGAEFIAVFREEAAKLGKLDHFAQGTIYPDVIESGAVPGSNVIKSHHNVGGLPKELGFTSLIEPLRMLFKDEVRQLGLVLGLPADMVYRQPFPGPGLAIRVLGDLTREKLHLVRESDAILREEFERAGLDRNISQFFTVLTNVYSVGVMGDERTYSAAIAIRAVTTDDFMTADWARIPYDTLALVSRRIVNEVPGVNRVLFDV
ncbi:MAG TPA: glutamine-hydrolyzing GMP synthase, partial [Clostridiales bacterium]|nr:glutamine-hydrolyzing GMP synthase [Clostridiales bacterium]